MIGAQFAHMEHDELMSLQGVKHKTAGTDHRRVVVDTIVEVMKGDAWPQNQQTRVQDRSTPLPCCPTQLALTCGFNDADVLAQLRELRGIDLLHAAAHLAPLADGQAAVGPERTLE